LLILGSGVGRVVFQDDTTVPKALALNGTDYKGAKLRVEQHRSVLRRSSDEC
jgi:hypothetical protein